MIQINSVAKKLMSISTFKVVFLICSFLYTFPFTAIIMSELFKVFIIWGTLLLLYDFFKRKKYGFNSKTLLIIIFVFITLIGVLFNYRSNLYSNFTVSLYLFVQSVCMLIYDKSETKDSVFKEIKRYSNIIVFITFICSILSLLIYLLNIKLSIYNGYQAVLIGVFEGRLWSIYGNPNTLGHFSLLSILFSLILFILNNSKKNKTYLIINIVFQWLCILLSNSRSTLVGVFGALFILVFYGLAEKGKNNNQSVIDYIKNNIIKLLLKVLSIIVGVIGLSIIIKHSIPYLSVYINIINSKDTPTIISTNPSQIDNGKKIEIEKLISNEKSKIVREQQTEDISNGRFEIWKGAVKVSAKRPIFGVGFKNVNGEINKYINEDFRKENPQITENTHNIYLQILTSHGIIALVVFVSYFILLFKENIMYLSLYKGNDSKLYFVSLITFCIIMSLLSINLFDSNILYFFSLFCVPIFWLSININEKARNIKNDDNKVLFLIDSLAGGGAEKVLVDFVNNLNQKKYNIEVKTIYNEGIYIDNINVKYTSIIKKPNIWKKRIINRIIKWVPRNILYSIFINDSYDYEISFLEFLSNKILSGSNSNSTKISWVHSDIFELKHTETLFRNRKELIKAFQNYDKIVFVSNESKEKFCNETNIYQDTCVIYNPIDVKKIEKFGKEEVDEISHNQFNIISVGRLSHEKGYSLLLEVINKLKDNHENVRLYILGEGRERRKLEKYIKDNSLEEYVHLLGFQKNPYAYVSKSDLFVSASLNEGYSLAIAEAISLGVPVVATRTSGAKELLENGKFGVLVDSSFESIYDALNELIDNKTKLKQMQKESIKRKNSFGIKSSIERINYLLEKPSIHHNYELFCTIFTPTWNRAHTLPKLYESLKHQTCFDFEWLVVDDGSKDETENLFKKWKKEKNKFNIRYYKVENGGKQRAINKATDLANGKMFFIVDSDDYIAENAIEKIKEWEQTIAGENNYAGVSGYKGYSIDNPIGKCLNKEYIDIENNYRAEVGLLGDKAECYYTDIIKKYKFPEIKGESFVSESVVWDRIGKDKYKIRWFNKVIYICDYLNDGYTNQGIKLYKNNPKGYLTFIRNEIRFKNISLKAKLQHYYGYYDAMKEKKNKKDICTDLLTTSIVLNIAIFAKKIISIIKGD